MDETWDRFGWWWKLEKPFNRPACQAATELQATVNSSCVIAKAEPGPCSSYCLLFGLFLISGQFVFILLSAFPGDIDLKTLINMITASKAGVGAGGGWGGGVANRRMQTSHCCCSTFSSVMNHYSVTKLLCYTCEYVCMLLRDTY
jgi:hypothetical protein